MHALTAAFAGALLVSAGASHAHGDEKHPARTFDPARAEQQPFGIAGDPRKATRTLKVAMSDAMHFLPSVLKVRKGETVRFIVRNEGRLLHELVLGTEDELRKHADLMRKFPDMEHDEPHMVHVQPGEAGDLVWTFNRAGEFHFACLVGGHYEAGMKGRIIVE
ncbi:MAG: cupredoxin family protein [Burkholderiales bacterium]|nr:cupredoxin family protein [Burkholderiales bacterium]GIK86393.1 MAG: copper oxidase [Betaproteobacteria bacterium]